MSGRRKKKFDQPLFEQIEITDAGAEGKAIARVDSMVIFVPFAAPGDVVDIKVIKKKKSFYEGNVIKYHQLSEKRVDPRCGHFGLCGGCKWQHLSYDEQLFLKQKQVIDNFQRIGKLTIPPFEPIKPSSEQYFYRNKLEFSFSNRKWLSENEKVEGQFTNANGVGMHLPGMFDRIVDIENCYLQREPSNSIRLFLKDYGIERSLTFYDARIHGGFLRNVTIRTTSTGETMVILAFGYNDDPEISKLTAQLMAAFPEITSLFTVINPKKNDTINDLQLRLVAGKPYITEQMDHLSFKIGPLSFYQTNPQQAQVLYETARSFAAFEGHELVYDLYCGTGTITNFIAGQVKKVIGIEYIPEAIADAFENSRLNGISNTDFVVGDIAATLNEDFVNRHGKPDVVITDPPRSGMHPKVIEQLLRIAPQKIVYVSCNPATQARDIALLSEKYSLDKIQPVDMFPQTHHVENVTLLTKLSPAQAQPAAQAL
mgnify:CR=1 FL=1